MNAGTTQSRRELTPIDRIKRDISTRADEFRAVLPSHITPDKFQRVVATAVLSNPKLLECDRQSLLMAAMKLAQDGLLPDGREAALAPFKTRVKIPDTDRYEDRWLVQPMPMAFGLRKKVLQSGEVISLQVGVVYRAEVERGHFIYEIGIEPPIRHRPALDLTDDEMADDQLIAAYSIARVKNHDGGEPYWSVEVMRRVEVLKVRQMSQTGALGQVVKFGKDKGKPIEPKGPWVDWQPEMWKKTVLRRHTKVLPMSSDLIDAFERDMNAEQAAESAMAMLAAEPGSITLPSRGDLEQAQIDDARGGDLGFDPVTGEIEPIMARDPVTGMTEVDEATARELDAQAGPDDGRENDARSMLITRLKGGIKSAKNLSYLGEVEKEFIAHRAALPDDVVADLEAALSSARRRLA